MFQWRRFNFFEKEAVRDDPTLQMHTQLSKLDVTCTSSGRGQIVIGDASGQISLMDRNFRIQSFQAYECRVTHLHQLKQSNTLVSIGDEEDGTGVVKVWDFDKMDKVGTFVSIKTFKLFGPKDAVVDVTSLVVSEDLMMIATGLSNGSIILRRGDIMRGRFQRYELQLPSQTPVTGLGYEDNGRNQYLFAASSSHVVLFTNTNPEPEVLDEQGGGPKQVVFTDDHEMIVGKQEAVYFYGKEGRGSCFAFEGDKKLLGWFRGYLLVVSSDQERAGTDNLSIYDLKNKFIAYSGPFLGLAHLICEWGSVFVGTTDRQFHQLTEKDTQTKLEILFRRNLYSTAISLAHSQQFDYAYIVDIFRKYGDHLYGKGDFDGAMVQYLRTITKLEPSYVIRKFLDAQRIHNLTSYLQALHEKRLANPDHTTLLLNCYTKLKDVKKLDEFIKTENATFEVETAIKVCKQAGYFDHALFLAKKFGQHDFYIKIQLEDKQDFAHALEYISTLEFYEAEKNLKKYGKMLVTRLPEQTTSLLMELCCRPPDDPAADRLVRARAEEFIHIFVDQPQWLATFLEFIVNQRADSPALCNTLLELYLRIDDPTSGVGMSREENYRKALAVLQAPEAKYDPDHALVLCQLHRFSQGVLYLYEKAKLYSEILQHFMEKEELAEVVNTCKQYGEKDPNLWVSALVFFAQREQVSTEHILEILKHIEQRQLLPPLIVIQILAANSAATLVLVKDFVTRSLQRDLAVVAEDKRMIKQYTEETARMRNEMHDLRSNAQIFQMRNCSLVSCSQPLDMPSVHFLCMHSFHQRCLGENERECPVCEADNKKVLEMKKSLDSKFDVHEQFFKQLEGTGDGFSTVAEYFGRGLFNRPPLGGDALLTAFANVEKGANRS